MWTGTESEAELSGRSSHGVSDDFKETMIMVTTFLSCVWNGVSRKKSELWSMLGGVRKTMDRLAKETRRSGSHKKTVELAVKTLR